MSMVGDLQTTPVSGIIPLDVFGPEVAPYDN